MSLKTAKAQPQVIAAIREVCGINRRGGEERRLARSHARQVLRVWLSETGNAPPMRQKEEINGSTN